MKTITYEQLENKGACLEQLNKFKELFGDSVKVTEKACLKVAQEFNWNWAAENLLNTIAYQQYNEAHAIADKQYYETRAIAYKQYEEAYAIADKQYYETCAIADKQYDEAYAIAQKQYYETRAIAYQQYKEAHAIAFAKAYLGMPK